jgi:ribose-phosphate pyrophosphokinase
LNSSSSWLLDGEVTCVVQEAIGGKDVFIIQPCANPVNDHIMEILLLTSCAKRSGALRVTAVIPYFGYKYHRRGEPISTKNQSRFLWSAAGDFAKMLTTMGVDRIIAVDLHRPGQGQETCFFDTTVPVENVSSNDLMLQYFKDHVPLSKNVTVVAASPDFLKKARKLQIGLKQDGRNVQLAAFLRKIDSTEVRTSRELTRLLGDVKDSDVIIVDDILDTGGTLSNICHRVKLEGAAKVYICASHGMFTENSMDIIRLSPVDQVIVTNSLPLPSNAPAKIVQLSVAPLLAQIIETEHYASIQTRQIDEEIYESE